MSFDFDIIEFESRKSRENSLAKQYLFQVSRLHDGLPCARMIMGNIIQEQNKLAAQERVEAYKPPKLYAQERVEAYKQSKLAAEERAERHRLAFSEKR